MNLVNNLVINIYSIALLIIIYLYSLKHAEKESMQYKLYFMILKITILMLVLDIFSRFDGKPDTIYLIINHFGNFMIFFLSPILPSLWFLYVHFQVSHEELKIRRLFYPLLVINAINAVMVVLSQSYGWLYYIDNDNIYHRGSLFLLPALITISLILASFVLVVLNREKIEKRYYFSLLFFAIPPFVCIILQIIFYGFSLMLNSVVLSLLIVFLNIQNQDIHTDYLTGVHNRKKLETYLKDKISTCTENKTFSAIMIDLDNFKLINDTFGHDIGDYVLETSAKLLKSCIRSNDFIARFGGDEFFIILDISDGINLEKAVCRINDCIEKYNESSSEPYKLSFSMGYAVYDYHSHMKAEEFEKYIDLLMYENKRINKEIKAQKAAIDFQD